MGANILSRRSLLRASSFLAATVVAAPAIALAAPTVPEVLTLLLTEYREAAAATRAAYDRHNDVRREKDQALERACLYVPFSDGSLIKLGEIGRSTHPCVVANLLRSEQKKELAIAVAGADRVAVASVQKKFAVLRRTLARRTKQYRRIEALSGYEEAVSADSDAYQRFTDAEKALRAYRPASLAEMASIARVVGEVGPFVALAHGLSVRDIAVMLNPEMRVA